MQSIQRFYKGKKVLVTGHTGFKGSWLSIWLKQLGAEVVGIALDPRHEKDIFNLASLSAKLIDYRQDIRDLEKLEVIMAREKPEIVFHLAAQALVIPSYENPVDTFVTNIIGTANILEACRHTPSVKQIVIVTTDKVYENKETMTGYRETDPLGGYDPYSASKAAAEIIAQSYRQSFFQSTNHSINQSISTARAGNVIGGGDWSEYRLIPDCIRSLEAGQPVLIRNPDSVRPWQHVLEPLAGYLLLAMKMSDDPAAYSGAWNFGPADEDLARVSEVAGLLISLWGSGRWTKASETGKLHEAGLLRLDSHKSKELLGWRPVLDFREAVRWTADWYKTYKESDVYSLCTQQIELYTER